MPVIVRLKRIDAPRVIFDVYTSDCTRAWISSMACTRIDSSVCVGMGIGSRARVCDITSMIAGTRARARAHARNRSRARFELTLVFV